MSVAKSLLCCEVIAVLKCPFSSKFLSSGVAVTCEIIAFWI